MTFVCTIRAPRRQFDRNVASACEMQRIIKSARETEGYSVLAIIDAVIRKAFSEDDITILALRERGN